MLVVGGGISLENSGRMKSSGMIILIEILRTKKRIPCLVESIIQIFSYLLSVERFLNE